MSPPPPPPPPFLVSQRATVQTKKKKKNNDREQQHPSIQQMPLPATTATSRKRPHSSSVSPNNEKSTGRTTKEEDERVQKQQEKKKTNPTAGAATTKNKNSHNATTTTNGWTAGQCINVSERYEKVKRLGEGTYGVVYQARDNCFKQHNNNSNNNNKNNNNNGNSCMVALKRCIPHHQASDGFPITTLREIHALRLCARHKHIVHLHHVAVSRNGVFLVLEYCEHDMAQLIDGHYQKYHTSPFRPEHVKTLLQQLLSAMDHVHAHCSLIHRDVKLSNLLYNNNNNNESKGGGGGGGCLKLCDFGLARIYSNDYYLYSSTNVLLDDDGDDNDKNNKKQQQQQHRLRLLTPNVVSLWYRPPELLLGAGSSYTQAIDMWAVGCVMAELVLGRPLLNGTTELQQVEQIFDVIGVPTRTSSATAVLVVPTNTNKITTTTPMVAPTRTSISANNNNNDSTSSSYFNLMDLPMIRNGKVQVPRKSRRRLLTLLGDVLTPAAMKILTQLLHLNHPQRWTAHEALTLTTYFTTELPHATVAAKMPRFSA